MEDGKKYSALKKLSCIENKNHILLMVRGTPYSIFVWRGKIYWDDSISGETLSFEEVFDKLPDAIKEEVIFNLDLFR